MTVLYVEMKTVNKSRYLVVKTSAKSTWDFPEMPKKIKKHTMGFLKWRLKASPTPKLGSVM